MEIQKFIQIHWKFMEIQGPTPDATNAGLNPHLAKSPTHFGQQGDLGAQRRAQAGGRAPKTHPQSLRGGTP